MKFILILNSLPRNDSSEIRKELNRRGLVPDLNWDRVSGDRGIVYDRVCPYECTYNHRSLMAPLYGADTDCGRTC
jgi:hypothetical protein